MSAHGTQKRGGTSLPSDSGAVRASEVKEIEAFEAGFAAPLAEVGAGKIKGIAKLDKHIQGHEQAECVFSALVVDQRLNSDQGSARRQSVPGGGDELHFLL